MGLGRATQSAGDINNAIVMGSMGGGNTGRNTNTASFEKENTSSGVMYSAPTIPPDSAPQAYKSPYG